jgi:cytochrome c553
MVRVRTIRTAVAVTIMTGAVACNSTPTPGIARGEAIYDTCEPCHGTDGSGNQQLGAPAIAGLPQGYITAQLEKYQNGQRGANPFDTVGLRMKSMSLALDLEGDLESVAEYVASMADVDALSSFEGGDADAGRLAFGACAACHGASGEGNEALGAPPLQGQHDWYLLKQLRKFKSGWRGTVVGDIGGSIMRANTIAMDDANMENLVAFIRTLEEGS